MTDKDDRSPAPLGERRQLMCRRADLTDRTRRAVDIVGPHGLDRIDDRQLRSFGLERGQNVSQVGFRGELDRRIRQSQPLRAHPYLRRSFLARNVDRFQTSLREAGRGLQQKRGFANARIAADKNGRCRYQSAAENAVEFYQTGGGSWRGRL